MAGSVVYIQGADLPDLTFAWKDSDGDLIDFSTGYTFELRLGAAGSAALVSKTTGITGAATDPNVTVAWATTGELNTLAVGSHDGQLIATRVADNKQRALPFALSIAPGFS